MGEVITDDQLIRKLTLGPRRRCSAAGPLFIADAARGLLSG
jgi:hypothetical protein